MCRVTLRRAEEIYIGEAEGVESDRLRTETAARAAVNAVAKAGIEGRSLAFEGARLIGAFDREFVFVALTTRVGRDTAQGLHELIAGDAAVERVGKLATMYLGPEDVMLAVEIRFHSDNSLEDIRQAIARITHAIRERHPRVRHVFLDAMSIAHNTPSAS